MSTQAPTFPPMYRSMVALDRVAHKGLQMLPDASGFARAEGMNSVFLNVVEFGDACREFPIVFVRTGDGSGQPTVAPLAVMGLVQGENLFLKGAVFTGDYAPAYLRRYPFAMARLDDGAEGQMAVCFDDQWDGFATAGGNGLFNEQSEPTELTQNIIKFLESYEMEVERTREACRLLDAAGVLEPMRFEADLPDGKKIEVDGFLAVNGEKLSKLDDAKVLEMHRNGLLAVLEMHRLSLANMGRLAAKRNSA